MPFPLLIKAPPICALATVKEIRPTPGQALTARNNLCRRRVSASFFNQIDLQVHSD